MAKSKIQREVEQFIRRELLAARPEGPLARLEIRSAGETSMRLGFVEVPSEGDGEERVEKLGDEVMELARRHADYEGGVQKYEIRSFRGEDRTPVSRTWFRVEGYEDGESERESKATNGAQFAGVAAKWGERAYAQLLEQNRQTIEALREDLAQSRLELADYRESDLKARKLINDLQDHQLERELKASRERNKIEAAGSMMKLFTGLLPAAIQKGTGIPLLPAGMTAERSSIRTWFGALTDQERQRFLEGMQSAVSHLPEEKSMALFVILQQALGDGPEQAPMTNGAIKNGVQA